MVAQNENEQPQDFARTTRAHAGEAITDSRAWPGYFLMALGFVALGLGLTAAGGGFEGWVLVAGIACPVLLLAGLAVVLLERKRVKAAEGKSLTDPGGH
ncbi:hypothetical protein HQ325_17420 [Rhodococcus sp. BP-349]|uniref:hypothetical protein n=1 Tax=unclassified Rhodococcus (in: high G+C Gram-positive bacteria) TaxID=192944 RepID=UPI0004813CF4|nr:MULTISPECIES: hypothetical protein [unclassified Rhodococcus (in: high G+C Gram-positive bacteria)]KQU30284.1 hypothetical protein ASG69_04250 [Rhodococcus sp. Leaf225]KQU44811.1 hypothetical protein ASH03_12890 [Rhodococcus sp. Leaf258]MBY6540456.1 hypothetical protein [Rhodococcus sp. BP-363]MBY6545519.1 hypothetical protein [Rhodococcus sp. BP-369]MBY6564749.1 hypothetical protein [Rhodococcus sp. BP-370]